MDWLFGKKDDSKDSGDSAEQEQDYSHFGRTVKDTGQILGAEPWY